MFLKLWAIPFWFEIKRGLVVVLEDKNFVALMIFIFQG